ncbi:type IVB secretion system protein IcmH/DotU [Novosphingobium bradum]|uniref:Type IVB secretion system protein IcmH/DotU n=1 Tax=Novosphingobium bradum TaxID=1737444 RepID=A0ABV7IPI6_9SPHN
MSDDNDDATVFRPGSGGGTPASGVPGGGVPSGGAGATPPPPGAPQWAPPPPAAGYTPPSPRTLQAEPGNAPVAELNFAGPEPDLYGPEPLVAAAGRLIHLASHVRTMPIGPALEPLRRLCIQELEAFAKRARELGLEAKSVQLAHYILCAFLDDAVMSTPWGATSPWSRQSLLAAYHNDTQGGDRMFSFAEQMERDPGREPRLVELLYQCLSLGFEGRAALDPRGASLLNDRRARLAALIQRQRGGQPADLSPQWRGQEVSAGPFAPAIPLWAILSAIAVVALIIFSALLFRLSSKADVAIEGLDRAVGHQAPAAPPPPPQSATPLFEQFRQILKPDIDSGRLEVVREGNEIVVRLHNQGLFGSAQAEPASEWSDTFGRLAQAANLTKGPIRVEGHTDDQAIRSLAFPSNQELSEARAQSVAGAIESAGLADKGRVSTAGLGSTRPIGDNATDDGRRANRRVELRVANDIEWR